MPAVAPTAVGDEGVVYGVTDGEEPEGAPVPTEFVARTTNVYAVPLLSPLIVALVVEPSTSVDAPPGLATTLYLVIDLPPLLAGAAQVTTAERSPALAPTPVGLPGAVGV